MQEALDYGLADGPLGEPEVLVAEEDGAWCEH